MKKLITLFGIASCGVFFAQTDDVGINTSMLHSNAVLDVVSTNRGNNRIDMHCFTIASFSPRGRNASIQHSNSE